MHAHARLVLLGDCYGLLPGSQQRDSHRLKHTHVFSCCVFVAAVPAGTTELRVATVQRQGDIVLMTLAGQLSSAAQLLQVSA